MRTVSHNVLVSPSDKGKEPSMQAAVFSGGGCCRFEEVPRPIPGRRDLRVKLSGCALSDPILSLWSGSGPYPSIPGGITQEAWGIVESVGCDVTQFAPGDRVGILARYALAEYAVVDEDHAVLLPESLSDAPFLGSSLSCAVNVFKQSHINAGNHVIIIGQGFLGLILTQLAALAQANVTVLNRRPAPLHVARRFGAQQALQAVNYRDPVEIASRVRQHCNGRLGDIVIEATGQECALNLAAELAREGGALVIAGYHRSGPRVVDMRLWNLKGLRVTNPRDTRSLSSQRTLKETVDAVSYGLITPAPLISHVILPDRLSEGLELLRQRPDGYLKAIVDLHDL